MDSLKELDQHLATRSVLVNQSFTIADFAAWGALKSEQFDLFLLFRFV